LKEAWQQAIAGLKQELPAFLYESLLRSADELGADSALRLVVEESALSAPLRSRYAAQIQRSLEPAAGRPIRVEFHAPPAPQLNRHSRPTWLNPKYTLAGFIRDRSNQMAAMACESVALQPGRSNPLFIYGDFGSGKTHLAQGTAALWIANRPGFRIHYAAFNDFRDQFLKSLHKGDALEFRGRLRSYDALIIEDIQYLRATGDSVQEEFFHLFDHYYETGKQILLTSERPIAELLAPSRLLSRLLSGLQVRIHNPGKELREAYVRMRNGDIDPPLSEEILQHLAARIGGGVRELESALNKAALLVQQGLALDSARSLEEHLNALTAGATLHFPLDRIIDVVCRRHQISKEQILGPSRKAEYTLPRHISMFLGLKYAGLNKSAIARYFRKSDHTTVINAERNIQRRAARDPGFQELLDSLIEDLRIECV
jgi:chromosomal replication initiator protein